MLYLARVLIVLTTPIWALLGMLLFLGVYSFTVLRIGCRPIWGYIRTGVYVDPDHTGDEASQATDRILNRFLAYFGLPRS